MEENINMENNIFREINKNLTKEDILMLGPLQLAYIGDAVFELMVRTYILTRDMSVSELHKASTKYVKAKGQSEIYHLIEEVLTEEEKTIVKRGRNTKTHTSPKNADMIDYKYATGFEALIGYLYITNKNQRLSEVFNAIINLKKPQY